MNTVGIVLAGGSGTRLGPITLGVSKQLLPVYDKPMIYYPLTTMLQAGIKNILVITQSKNLAAFRDALDDTFMRVGISLHYAAQDHPGGIAEAFKIAKNCGWPGQQVEYDQIALILGDNLFHGGELEKQMCEARIAHWKAHVFVTPVANPSAYGVARLSVEENLVEIVEKPLQPSSNLAVTGLYFYPPDVLEVVEQLQPSARGELEITDVNNHYISQRLANATRLNGTAWLDMGTPEALLQASHYVQTVQERHGTLIGAPEAAAYEKGWLSHNSLLLLCTNPSIIYRNELFRLAASSGQPVH